jgi:zinc transport system substrate-binding protein
VASVNYPLHYFVERIGGEQVEALFTVPAEEDPAFWKPDVEAIAIYQKADLILLNGATYAKWVETTTLPASKVVNTSATFRDRYLPMEGGVTHTHGSGREHAHGATAFTTWLDPQLAMQQAEAVRAALTSQRPEFADEFAERFAALRGEMQALDERMAAAVSAGPTRPLLFSHPVYHYLIERYKLNARSVHWEPEEPPTTEQWIELERLLNEHPARWMVWEGETLEATAAMLQERGIASVVFDPCANVPATGDFISTFERNVEVLEKLFADVATSG